MHLGKMIIELFEDIKNIYYIFLYYLKYDIQPLKKEPFHNIFSFSKFTIYRYAFR